MALIFMDGFDTGDMFQKWPLSTTQGYSSSTTTRYNSGRSIARGSNSDGELKKIIPAAATYICGFACMYNTNYPAFPASIIDFVGDNGATTHISLVTGDSPSTLVIRRGSTALFTVIVSTNQWHYLELKVTIDATIGSVELRDNGVVIGSFSGNTKNGGTNSSIDMLKLGGSGNSTGITIYRDDLYLLDTTGPAPYNTYLGEIRVRTLSPTAAGASTQFMPDSGANYSRVNEIPYSAANYVQSGTPGQRDTYTLADLPAATGSILAVQNNVIAKKTDAAAVSIKTALRSGATVYYGGDTALGPGDTTLTDLRTTDPATGTTWTAGGVNALEAGMEIV